MESAAKRKRPSEKGDAEGGPRKKAESAAVVVAEPPTEEEVEEFFAILRRMHVAIKYFEKCKSDGKAHDPKTEVENWRTALETEPFEGIDGVNDDKLKRGEIVEESRVLDLNATPPEAETEINSAQDINYHAFFT